MLNVLKGTLTRRMFFIFLSLSLLPTIFLLIVPSVLQIRSEQSAISELEVELQSKAEGIFTRLVTSKASHFEQILQPRLKPGKFIATQITNSIFPPIEPPIISLPHVVQSDPQYVIYEMDTGHQFWAQNSLSDEELYLQKSLSSAITSAQWYVEQDPSLCGINIVTVDDTVWTYPRSVANLTTVNLDILSTIEEATINSTNAVWTFNNTDTDAKATVWVPFYLDGEFWGAVGSEICLDMLIEEIPKFGLAESATMMLVSENGRYLTMPSWGKETFLIDGLKTEPDLANNSAFIDLLPATVQERLIAENFLSRLRLPEQFVLRTESEHQIDYIAAAPVSDSPLTVLLLLPQEDIFNQAKFYGATFKVSVPAIVMQAAISIVGFILVITFGALFSLRQIAEPIAQLSTGAENVARGDLTQRVPEVGPGEMQQLAQSFNTMVDSIQASHQALESNQKELAATLQIREDEFFMINQVAVLSNTAGSLSEKLALTLQIMNDHLPVTASAIFLTDESQSLIPVAWEGEKTAVLPSLETQMKLVHQSIQSGILTYLPEKSQFPIVAALPISFRRRIVGVTLFHYPHQEELSESILTLLNALSNHIAILIENARLQNQERILLVTEERRRLARELHDSVTQSLFSLSMIAEGLRASLNQANDSPVDLEHPFDLLILQSQQIRTEMRNLIQELRPIDASGSHLDEVIKSHVQRLQRISDIEINTSISDQADLVSPAITQHLDRIMQEALSNITRHSQATAVSIMLEINKDNLLLSISDNGIGFDPHTLLHDDTSYGLNNMRERTEMMGGSFSINADKNQGTTIKIIVPNR